MIHLEDQKNIITNTNTRTPEKSSKKCVPRRKVRTLYFRAQPMYSDILPLIRICYRSTPYPPVSIIMSWSSSVRVSETVDCGGKRGRERILQVINVAQLVSCHFFFFCRTGKGRGETYRTYMAEMPERYSLLTFAFCLKGRLTRVLKFM